MRPVLLAALLLMAGEAWGHQASVDWTYDGVCCNGNTETGDCQPIPASAVRMVDGGYEITLKPGDHHMVTTPHKWFHPQNRVRWSKDENYHVCLYPDESKLQCFYAVPMGF